MKDYKLSEIKEICEDCTESGEVVCEDCPLELFCLTEFQHCPSYWKIDKIEDATLVRLPCKVGDIVYTIYAYKKIHKGKVVGFRCTQGGGWAVVISSSDIDFAILEGFDNIFFTKEKAEARLKELQEIE